MPKDEQEDPQLEFKDYLAFVIALLTTHLLPFIAILIATVVLTSFIVHLF